VLYTIFLIILIWSSLDDSLLSASAYKGVDLSTVMHKQDWESYMKTFSANPVDFAVVRIYNDNATVVATAPKTIIGAHHAGITNISLYMFPCIGGSRWTAEKGLSCPPAAEQLDEIVHFLGINGINFKFYPKKWNKPTASPTTFAPSAYPSISVNHPTANPTPSPSTSKPTPNPTTNPTLSPTVLPTVQGNHLLHTVIVNCIPFLF
jgi:hypothetical protein